MNSRNFLKIKERKEEDYFNGFKETRKDGDIIKFYQFVGFNALLTFISNPKTLHIEYVSDNI